MTHNFKKLLLKSQIQTYTDQYAVGWFIFFFFTLSLFTREFNPDVNLSLRHCHHVNFVRLVNSSCCFQTLQILCWGTGLPSSRLLLLLLFSFPFGLLFLYLPTDQKSGNAFDKLEKKGWPCISTVDLWFIQSFFFSFLFLFGRWWRVGEGRGGDVYCTRSPLFLSCWMQDFSVPVRNSLTQLPANSLKSKPSKC